MEKTFGKWPKEIHSDPEQIKRMQSASKAPLTPVEIYDNKTAQFSGKHGRYITSLNDCQCGDFIGRKLPCKHIYRLAYEIAGFDLGVEVKTSKKAIARPDDEVIEEIFSYMIPFLDEISDANIDAVCSILEIIHASGRLSVVGKALEYLSSLSDTERR